jgi:hypothetical protein
VVSVQQEHGAGAHLDPGSIGQRLDQVERVGIAAHRHGWGHLLQTLEHRCVTDIAGMHDESDLGSTKEFDDRI